MKKITLVHSIVMIAALAACAPSITITSDWDPGFDFLESQTFVMLENDISGINRFIEQRVTAAIAAELSSKELQQVDIHVIGTLVALGNVYLESLIQDFVQCWSKPLFSDRSFEQFWVLARRYQLLL